MGGTSAGAAVASAPPSATTAGVAVATDAAAATGVSVGRGVKVGRSRRCVGVGVGSAARSRRPQPPRINAAMTRTLATIPKTSKEHRQDPGHVGRAAARHHIDRRENLEGADEQHHHDEQGCRLKKRKGDAPQSLPVIGAVDARRFEDLFGHVLQAGQEDHHVGANALPDREDDNGRHGPFAAGQPFDLMHAERLHKEKVESCIGHINQPPHDRGRDPGGNGWDKEGGAEKIAAVKLTVDEQGQHQRDDGDRDGIADGEVQGRLDRLMEVAVAEQTLVVLKPHEARRREEIPVGEADIERVEERIDPEDRKIDDGWRHEKEPPDRLALLERAADLTR